MKKRVFSLLLLISFIPVLAGCGKTPSSSTIFAMDTVMELTVYGSEDILKDAENLIFTLDSKLSVTDDGSEIYALNQNGRCNLSEDTTELILQSLTLCERTNGALDISVYPIVREWGFTTGEYKIPDQSRISQLLQSVNYKNIKISSDGFAVLGNNMKIDLGSVAKGYAGDRITELFRDKGVTSAMINLGGNVQTLGAKPDGSPWRIAIKDPLSQGNACVLEIIDKSVITSGGYERYFEQDGKIYHHIIDPSTGYPADNDLLSVSIVGDKGVICDAMSTSLFVMGYDKAVELWKSSDDFEAVFITSDKTIHITEGLKDIFSPLGSYKDSEFSVIYHD